MVKVAESEPVAVMPVDEKNIAQKLGTAGHRTTRERLREFYGEEFKGQHIPQKEVDWGQSAGKEVW